MYDYKELCRIEASNLHNILRNFGVALLGFSLGFTVGAAISFWHVGADQLIGRFGFGM